MSPTIFLTNKAALHVKCRAAFLIGLLVPHISVCCHDFREGANMALAFVIFSRMCTPKGQFGSHLPHIRQSSAVAERDQ